MDIGNLISGSSAFCESSLNIWKFWVCILLKSCFKNFEHYFASMWNECNFVVVWTFFGIAFLGDWNENWLFQSCGHCWVFQTCWHIECSTFTASSFRIWNNSTGIPSPPLALFIVMLSKAHLTSHSRMSGSRWVITPSWLSWSWRSFSYSSSVYSWHLFLIFSHGKEMQKSKMAVCGGFTNSCKKKRSKKQRRKGKIEASECRVPKNSKERSESLPQRSMQRNRGKQQNEKD